MKSCTPTTAMCASSDPGYLSSTCISLGLPSCATKPGWVKRHGYAHRVVTSVAGSGATPLAHIEWGIQHVYVAAGEIREYALVHYLAPKVSNHYLLQRRAYLSISQEIDDSSCLPSW